MAFDPFGCRVLQKILEKVPLEKSAPIQIQLQNDLLKLCTCEYGNYIMQHLIKNGPVKQKASLLKVLEKNFYKLSIQKCGSHVTEKSLMYSNDQYKQNVLNELMHKDSYSQDYFIFLMMDDKFGNFVIQKLFEHGNN